MIRTLVRLLNSRAEIILKEKETDMLHEEYVEKLKKEIAELKNKN